MSDPQSVADMQKQQEKLQFEFNNAQKAIQNAVEEYKEVKAALVKFNDKYGRIIQIINEEN